MGEVACVGWNAGTWGAVGGPARSHLQVSETHPAGITPGTLSHRPKECVCREDILGYLYSHFIYNPNSKTETVKYIDGQVHSRQSNPTSAPTHL